MLHSAALFYLPRTISWFDFDDAIWKSVWCCDCYLGSQGYCVHNPQEARLKMMRFGAQAAKSRQMGKLLLSQHVICGKGFTANSTIQKECWSLSVRAVFNFYPSTPFVVQLPQVMVGVTTLFSPPPPPRFGVHRSPMQGATTIPCQNGSFCPFILPHLPLYSTTSAFLWYHCTAGRHACGSCPPTYMHAPVRRRVHCGEKETWVPRMRSEVSAALGGKRSRPE